MVDQRLRLTATASRLSWFCIFGVEFRVEDVLSDDYSDVVEHAIQHMDIIGNPVEIALHEVEGEMSDRLCDNCKVLYALFGQFVQTVVSIVLSVVLAQVQEVVLAENAGFLSIVDPHLIRIEGHICPYQQIDTVFLLCLPLLIFLKQILMWYLNPTLQTSLLLNHHQLALNILFLLPLLLKVLRPPDILTSQRALDLLAHFLAENGQRFYDDLYVISG